MKEKFVMRKVFLCHSNLDKAYVEKVVQKLERVRVQFDTISIEVGTDFRPEIAKTLGFWDIVIFFVSRESLAATWKAFDYQIEKDYFSNQGDLACRRQVVIIDTVTCYADLPPWMQTMKAVVEPYPYQVSCDVQQLLYAIKNPTLLPKLFVGRQDSLAGFSTRLKSASDPQKLLVAIGLPGMGCRTYLEHACQNLLGRRLEPMLSIGEDFGLERLYTELSQEIRGWDRFFTVEPLSAPFNELPVPDQMNRIVALIEAIWTSGRVPCLVDDDNQLLDQDGGYRPLYADLLRLFLERNTEAQLAIVQRRHPKIDALGFPSRILLQKLQALRSDDTRFLLLQVLKASGMMPNLEQVEDLLPAISTRTSSVYAAMRVIGGGTLLPVDYAKPTLLEIEAPLFLESLRNMNFRDGEWKLLRMLVRGESWSLDELVIASGQSAHEVSESLRALVDNSVVEADKGRFSLSLLVREAFLWSMEGPSIAQRFLARKQERPVEAESSVPSTS